MRWKTRGLLFDMDGVLVSSLGSVERSWTKWAAMHGVDRDLAIRTAHGCRAIETIRRLRPDLDDQAELKVIEDIEVADNEGISILPGVVRILKGLPEKYWTVVTSATERLARVRMGHAGIPVPRKLVTADMVKQGKPNPEPYLRGAELLGLKPEECVVIEDAPSGTNAGHAAGCKVLATTFSHSMESLAAADWIIRSLEDLRITILPGDEGLELEFEPLVRP
ncbi:MAG TPA: HAD family hydrolase [Acidisarcina sp.]|nr:HAD family hydrolase [Acidisarcina sp.]